MTDEVAVVFTAKSIERILREGGTAAWRLDRNHARKCTYAVCTRNANADWVEGSEPHHSAFLIGKVSDVVSCPGYEGRYLIQFSEYASLNVPDAWKGDRNPVKYATLDELDISSVLPTLKWKPMPAPSANPEAPSGVGDSHLTIAEAKKGLALTFGVPPEAIEITIRG